MPEACPSTGAAIISANAKPEVSVNRLARSTGTKPFKTSQTRQGMPTFTPQCLNALNAPGLPSSESSQISCRVVNF